ncbi:LysM and BON domain-containing protein [Wenzhouxiangella marina]|uniref:Potassium binding protein Kbp n=1 Tax=Wenzhouxiangella marina TaxID=1579979 RepID=A0A0K0XZ22_9GAMM|nr:LysM and BON domain-containing protein [Wenzhouxiangella marina]AKS42871.1 peptidase M23B [Wenzhouxiangella marina]MBB6087447.1 nucleoid-associated protein YgaU [Wenzhouxiangella marina]
MGFFDFVGNAGSKLFGGGRIDENAVREHLLGLGLKVRALSVIAHQDQKMVSLVGQVDTLEDKEKLIVAAGNVNGVERVDDRLRLAQPDPGATIPAEAPAAASGDEQEEPPAEEQPESQFYTVKSGDTLGGIAKQFYGNAGKYPLIFEANRPMLSDPNKIYPGQVLRIPQED